MTAPGVAFVVHVAGAPTKVFPGPDTAAAATQRCLACGFLLIDNTAWMNGTALSAPLALMAEGGEYIDAKVPDGPSWYPAGALIGTDKVDGRPGGMTYVHPDGRPLGDDEVPCV